MIHAALFLLLISAPCEDARPLNQGKKAPCTGTLVPDAALIALIDGAEKCQAYLFECEQTQTHTLELSAIKAERHAALLNIEIDRGKALSDALDKALSAERFSWYEHPAFVATVSIVMTAALAAGVYALSLELSL